MNAKLSQRLIRTASSVFYSTIALLIVLYSMVKATGLGMLRQEANLDISFSFTSCQASLLTGYHREYFLGKRNNNSTGHSQETIGPLTRIMRLKR